MAVTERPAGAPFGWAGFATGAVALLLAVSLFHAGPFAPQSAAGVSLGELAAEIGQSAARKVVGLEQPAPQPVARDIDDYLAIGTALLGALAVILGATAFIREERRRPAIAAAALGSGAILFQFFAWFALALLGVLVLGALLQSLGDYFTGLFGG